MAFVFYFAAVVLTSSLSFIHHYLSLPLFSPQAAHLLLLFVLPPLLSSPLFFSSFKRCVTDNNKSPSGRQAATLYYAGEG